MIIVAFPCIEIVGWLVHFTEPLLRSYPAKVRLQDTLSCIATFYLKNLNVISFFTLQLFLGISLSYGNFQKI